MNDFCFANYYKIMKENSINSSVSDPRFISELFSIVTKFKYYDYDAQKGASSRIINRSLGVPSTIKDILEDDVIRESINKTMKNFLIKFYSINSHDVLWHKLKVLISRDKYLSANEINNILNDNDFNSFMTKVYIEAIRVPNKIVDAKQMYAKNGKSMICYDFNDVFDIAQKKKKIIVIPVDVNFELKIETPEDTLFPLVDQKTLHGKWINMMLANKCNLDTIKEKINNGIFDSRGIGNISIVPFDNNIYYLVSLSEFDEKNVAKSSVEKMNIVLEKILEAYIFNGQDYELIIPLMGTGKSKIGLTHEESLYMILNFFKKNLNRFSGEVRVVIYKDDINNIDI